MGRRDRGEDKGRRKPKSSAGRDLDWDWFADSPGVALFCWRPRHRRSVLLGGNRIAYAQLIERLKQLSRERDEGTEVSVRFAATRPSSEVPTCLLWFGGPRPRPEICKRPLARIDEIEQYYRENVTPFAGFEWFDELVFTVGHGRPSVAVEGSRVEARVLWWQLDALIAELADCRFPQQLARRLVWDDNAIDWSAQTMLLAAPEWLGIG